MKGASSDSGRNLRHKYCYVKKSDRSAVNKGASRAMPPTARFSRRPPAGRPSPGGGGDSAPTFSRDHEHTHTRQTRPRASLPLPLRRITFLASYSDLRSSGRCDLQSSDVPAYPLFPSLSDTQCPHSGWLNAVQITLVSALLRPFHVKFYKASVFKQQPVHTPGPQVYD